MTNIAPQMDHFERPDPILTNKIVTHLKSQGIFDQFRRECMADVDTKPAYHNLRQRVEGSVAAFLRMNPWRPDMNKNQVRDNLRKHIQSGGFLDIGVDRIVDQVVNPKIYTVFLPKVEEVVQSCLGMENDKPKFEPPPSTEIKSEPPKFQDKHNLAPRAKLPAPLMGPILKTLKPPDQAEGRSSPEGGKTTDDGGDMEADETSDKKYVVDEEDLEEKEEDEDDEESPPFEPHSEGDRLILGMRSDSSENSNDSQLVTTIVDDSLEERIDHNDIIKEEESDKKDDDSSSDEYVPKTPTINMEESDGTVLEFNSISEYKQYRTKFEEESVGNVEEVVSSQCMNEMRDHVKEENSYEEGSLSGAQKRKFNIDSFDESSSSSTDKDSSDEIKPAVFEPFKKKRYNLEEYDQENETSELSLNEGENEDSYTEKSLDMTDSKIKEFDNEYENHKGSSTSSKESGKSSHNLDNELRERTNHDGLKEQSSEKETHEKSKSSHSSRDKKDSDTKVEKHESSRDRHKERDRKRSESSSKLNEKDSKSKHYDKEKDKEKKRSKSSDRSKRDKEDSEKNKKESKHAHKDPHFEKSSRDHHDKDKKKHSSRDKHLDGKEDRDTAHKDRKDKDRKDDSKLSHSSTKHTHRSSSEKHKSDRSHKHKESSERHRSHDKKSDKDSKDDSRKKYRQHCKYPNDRDENRRSSDRDSSGPSSRTYTSSNSKTTSSRTYRESKVETGERTTSNSDNTVSDNTEALQDESKFGSPEEHGIASPDNHEVEDTSNESDLNGSEWHGSKEEQEIVDFESDDNIVSCVNVTHGETNNSIHSVELNCTENSDGKQDISLISLHDSSSEKENIEQSNKEQTNSDLDGNNTDASLDEDLNVIKFKKPKIARNIHEVKKIMEARRNLKRMEKKRMESHIKSNSEQYESDEKSPSEDKLEDESRDDVFRGFENVMSTEKIMKYNCLVERLENETLQLERLINYEQLNSNLITSWIDLNPDLDNYIENTLKGKVHRKYMVRLPPICDEFYKYDSDQNVYFLIKNLDDLNEATVDSNLNILDSVYVTDQQENKIDNQIKSRKFVGSVPCVDNDNILKGDYRKQNSSSYKISCENTQSDDNEDIEIVEENNASTNSGTRRTAKDDSKKQAPSSDVIASSEITFSLTFNQTYDEVLKEKAQNSVVPSKKEVENVLKTPRTVMKITKNNTSEHVFLKTIQSNSEDQVQVPRITKSETILNGKIKEYSADSKQIPLISRISKSKTVLPPTITKSKSCANGIFSPDSITSFEGGFSREVSQKIINDVIGIQDPIFDQGNTSDQSSQSGEESSGPKRRRTGTRRQQRYDSSDLYKPRLQLTSRRVRAATSSPEETAAAPQVIATRKRSAASDPNSATSKRRR